MVAGMFLFQMTMPVTLAALTVVHPHRPAFAFGLACLALLAGVLPAFYRTVQAYYGGLRFLGLILASAATIFVALRMLGRRVPEGARPPAPAQPAVAASWRLPCSGWKRSC